MQSIESLQHRQKFLSVVDELRAALGYALRESDPEPGDELAMEMMYGNFDFSVVHSYKFSPEKVLIECDFGEIPEGRRGSVVDRLLEMNMALAELDGSVFCINQENLHLIYALPLKILAVDGYFLLSKMTEIVWHGRRWMETQFLNKNNCDKNDLIILSHLA